MKTILIPATLLATGLLAAAWAPRACALEISRVDLTQSPGACVPTLPSDPVRYRVGGLRNAGASDIYVICGMRAPWHTSGGDGATGAYLRVRNTGTVDAAVQCTLHAGYSVNSTATSQGSWSKARVVGPSTNYEFDFSAVDALGPDEQFATPTFLCRLPPKTEVQYVLREYKENVGA